MGWWLLTVVEAWLQRLGAWVGHWVERASELAEGLSSTEFPIEDPSAPCHAGTVNSAMAMARLRQRLQQPGSHTSGENPRHLPSQPRPSPPCG